MSLTVRLATSSDKESVLKLLDQFSILFHSQDIPSQVGTQMYDEVMSRNDTMIFVAEEDNELCGIATFYVLPNIRHGYYRGHIEDIFVLPDKRKKGVGSKLLTAIKNYCQNNNITIIKVDSANELEDAHSFYEKNGGKQTEKMFRFDLES